MKAIEMTDNGIATDARSAWNQLQQIGGLELDGRDDGMEAAVLMALPVSAATLDEALDRISTDQLVRALFAVTLPYVEMFRAILDFFRTADACKGRDHWRIGLEDHHIDLEQFQSLLEIWQDAEIEMEAPTLDGRTAWALTEAIKVALLSNGDHTASTSLVVSDAEIAFYEALEQPTGDPKIDLWLETNKAGRYVPLPATLHPQVLPAELHELAAVTWIIGDIVSNRWGDRTALLEDYKRTIQGSERERVFPFDGESGYSPGTVAQHETDYWLRSAVRLLAYAKRQTDADLARIGDALAAVTGPFGRRPFSVRGNHRLLQKIFELPVWKERHSLYAVWIATEIINGCDGHDVVLHHDNGTIIFAFKKTLVATIATAEPPRQLYSERRVPLAKPVGDHNLKGAQPDYSLWRGAGDNERCDLVLEVKHYKRAARRRFSNVMTNYANAHPLALVALASHGPIGDPAKGVDPQISDRFRPLALLTTQNACSRRALRAMVRSAVGEPLGAAQQMGGTFALMVDVSGSMGNILKSQAFAEWYARQLQRKPSAIFAADEELRFEGDGSTPVDRVVGCLFGNRTALGHLAQDLCDRFDALIVATDADGLTELSWHPLLVDGTELEDGLVVVTVRNA